MEEIISQLAQYGLPVALSVLFIIILKKDANGQINTLKKFIGDEKEKFIKVEDLSTLITQQENSIKSMEQKIYSLERTIVEYVLSKKE